MRGPIRRQECEDSILEAFARNGALLRGATGVETTFIVEEEERPVLDDSAAERSAKLVAHQRLAIHAAAVVEPGVGRRQRVAVEFIRRPVKVVRTALGDQRDLAAR